MTRKKFCMFNVLAITLATVLAATGSADVITPVGVTASSTLDGNPASNLLSSAGMTMGSDDVSTWTWQNVYTGIWMSSEGTATTYVPQTLLFDLGSAKQLSKIDVWNFSHNEGLLGYNYWDAKGFVVFASDALGTVGKQLGSGTLNMVTSLPVTNQRFDLSSATTTQYVLVQIDSGYAVDDPPGGAYYVDIARVRFEGVPEPGTMILLLTGFFGLLCYAWRKRK